MNDQHDGASDPAALRDAIARHYEAVRKVRRVPTQGDLALWATIGIHWTPDDAETPR